MDENQKDLINQEQTQQQGSAERPSEEYTQQQPQYNQQQFQPNQQYQTPQQPYQGQYYPPQQHIPPYQQPMQYQHPSQNYYNPMLYEPARGLSIASLVMGILSIPLAALFIFGVLGVIFAAVAKSKGNRTGKTTAGLVLSIIGVAFSVLVLINMIQGESIGYSYYLNNVFFDVFNL